MSNVEYSTYRCGLLGVDSKATEAIQLHFSPGTTFQSLPDHFALQDFVTTSGEDIAILAVDATVLRDDAIRETIVQALDSPRQRLIILQNTPRNDSSDALYTHPQVWTIDDTANADGFLAMHDLHTLRVQVDRDWYDNVIARVTEAYEQIFPLERDYRENLSAFVKQIANIVKARQLTTYALRPAASEFIAESYSTSMQLPPLPNNGFLRDLKYEPLCHTHIVTTADITAFAPSAIEALGNAENLLWLLTTYSVDDLPGFMLAAFDRNVQAESSLSSACTRIARELMHMSRTRALRDEYECLRSITELHDMHQGEQPALAHYLKILQRYFGADGASWLDVLSVAEDKTQFAKTYIHYARPVKQVRFEDSRGFAHHCAKHSVGLVITDIDWCPDGPYGIGVEFDGGRLAANAGKPVRIATFSAAHTLEDEASLLYFPVTISGRVRGVIKLGNFRKPRAFDLQDLRRLRVFAQPMPMILSNAASAETMLEELGRASLPERLGTYAETLFLYREVALGMFHQVTNHLDEIYSELLLAYTLSPPESESAELIAKARTHTSDAKLLIKKAERRGEKLRPVRRHCALNREVMRPALDYLRRSAAFSRADNPIRLDHSFTNTDFIVDVDPDMLYESVINVLNNAVWAIKENRSSSKRTLFVAVRRGNDPATVKIEVVDSGIGVLPENYPRLGEAFFTTRKNGTGLGLFFARRLIESFDGKLLFARSQPNAGTTVNIILPCIQES